MASEEQGHRAAAQSPVEDEVHVVAEDTNTKKPPEDGEGAKEAEDSTDAKDTKKGSFWRELPVLVVVALILALIIKTFVVQAFYIPSESMENTLLTNDRVLVNKLVYHVRDIERGDIVVFSGVDSWDSEVQFEEPSNPITAALRWVGVAFGLIPGEKDYIKRVIGIPGDTVECCDAEGRITINGVPIDEGEYLYPGDVPSQRRFKVEVPEGRLWVMGDHRSVSLDSRAHIGDPGGGTIPIDRVVGRAFVIVWPFSRMTTLPIPETFTQPALNAAAAVGGAVPFLAGVAGAFPLVMIYRRLRTRR